MRTRLILDAALDAVVVIDAHGLVREWNPRAAETFGWSREEAIGQLVSDLIMPPESRPAHIGGIRRYAAGGEPRMLNRLVETTAMRRDGTHFPVELTITPIERHGEVEFSAFIRDVGERHRIERELREAQKLDAIGQLAGGVAHDFNNLLTAILGSAELIRRDAEASPQLREDAALIASVAKRGAQLARSLLTLARRGHEQTEAIHMEEVLQEVVEIISRTFDRRIALGIDVAPGAHVVRGDRSLVANAILNLAINARDAMPEGGALTLSVRRRSLDSTFTARHLGAVQPGPFIEVTVRDTGVGMTQDVRSRIFEPFFTTKSREQGTGLGLAMVYGTVRAHQGVIEVESEPGRGSSFRIFLPADAVAAAEPQPPDVPAVTGRGRVLLVDDEPDVLRVGVRLLVSLGYSVTQAADGVDAVSKVQDDPQLFDVVILDGNMPRMTGQEAAKQIRRLRPGLPLVLATGFFEPDAEARFEADGFAGAIAKPYSRETLARELSRVLDTTS